MKSPITKIAAAIIAVTLIVSINYGSINNAIRTIIYRGEIRGEHRSEPFGDLPFSLYIEPVDIQIETIDARGKVFVSQFPSEENAYEMIVTFNDDKFGAAEWYDVIIHITPSQAESKEPLNIHVKAYIDGVSKLVFRNNTVYWHNLEWAVPGRHEGNDFPTYINDIEWMPIWLGEEPTDCIEVNNDLLEYPEGKREIQRFVVQDGNSEKSDFSVSLPNGVTVELVGVCEHPSEGKQWWMPDGTLFNKDYQPPGEIYTCPKQGNCKHYEFVVRVVGPRDSGSDWDVPHKGDISSQGGETKYTKDQKLQEHRFAVIPKVMNNLTMVRVGTSAGDWETFARHTDINREEPYEDGKHFVSFGRAYEKEGATIVPITHNFTKGEELIQHQLLAVTQSGKRSGADRTSGFGKNGISSETYEFSYIPLKEIKELVFVTRDEYWVIFKNISLLPGLKSNVQIEVETAAQKEMENE